MKTLTKEIQEKIELELKARIKKDFDYQIPIADVEKAGISTTGAEIENELIPLSKEFTEYRKQNQLWENKFDAIKYEVMEDGKMFRIPFRRNENRLGRNYSFRLLRTPGKRYIRIV